MRGYILTLALTAVTASFCFAQDEYDDIYYNPKSSAKSHNGSDSKSKKKSNYIEDFGSIDVDDYNRRGFYYETPVDTIGSAAENAEDFVYTQQIQKYYNPTIVVDNSDILDDIIYNSYGNVEIIIDNGYPTFGSIYTGPYIWTPTYYNWYARPAWSWSYAWGPWTWNWTWGYSPVWTCGPSWSWGYYPGWNWGYYPGNWGYYPPRPPRPGWDRPYYGNYRPGGHRPAYPAPGWSSNTRPGGNYNGGYNRPSHGGSSLGRPGSQRPMGSRNPSGNNVSISDKVDRSHRNYTTVGSASAPSRTDINGTNKRSDIGKRYSNSRYESINTTPVSGGTVNPGSNRSIRSMRNNSTTVGTQTTTPSRTDRGTYNTRRNSNVTREQRTQSSHSTVTTTPRQEQNSGAWRNNSTTNRNSYNNNRNTTTNTQRNYNTTTTNRRSYNNTNTTNSNRSYNNSTTRNSNSTYRSNSGYSRGSSSGASRSGGSGRSGGFGRSSGGGGHRR